MCGIIAVVQRRARRPSPQHDELLVLADQAAAAVASESDVGDAATCLEQLDTLLRGASGVLGMLDDDGIGDELRARLDVVDAAAASLETRADEGSLAVVGDALETFNASLVRIKDAS